MRMKIIVFSVIIVCAFMLSSCNAQLNSGEATDTQNNTGTNGETEMSSEPSKNGDRVTIEQINEEKAYIIQALNDNYDVFCAVVDYFEKNTRSFSCRKDTGEIVIRCLPNRGNQIQTVDINETGISEQITYIIDTLGFEPFGSGEDSHFIDFFRTHGSHPYGGSYGQYLCYYKRNAPEEQLQESGDDSRGAQVHIRDRWFYILAIGGH